MRISICLALPVSGEVGVAVGYFFVEGEAEAGACGQVHVAVFLAGEAVEYLEVVRFVEFGVVFLYEEVRSGSIKMEAGDRTDGGVGVVRAMRTWHGSAMAAIFLSSVIPPALHISGWRMSTASALTSS